VSVEGLSERLAYRFRDPTLLRQALTHRSYAHRNNERLEFLGDALINFVVAEALFRLRPQEDEGALSRLRANLVREESLARIAQTLELGPLLHLGEGELKSGGWRRDSVLADAFEALIGAIFLDGGFEAASAVCMRLFEPRVAELPDAESLKDAKTRLQEWLQGRARPLPLYELLTESGPPHRRRFRVRCRLADAELVAEAEDGSRRGAEQKAAGRMLADLSADSETHSQRSNPRA
jgi:ribonuclease-3